MSTKHKTTLVIADDHELLREGLRSRIKEFNSLSLLAEASDGEQLVSAVEKLKPDVVITDIKMPLMDGIKATNHIKRNFPSVKVIIFSNYEEHALIVEAMSSGADGYLLKNASSPELFEGISRVMTGKMFFCPKSSEKILNHVESFTPQDEPIVLSKREKDLIRLIARDLATKEIAKELRISARTVETHRARLQNKLGIRSAVGLALYALKRGLV